MNSLSNFPITSEHHLSVLLILDPREYLRDHAEDEDVGRASVWGVPDRREVGVGEPDPGY